MILKVYAYKNCDTCRKALRWLEENDVQHEVVPIREQPPSESELRRMLGFYGGDLRKLFNTSGQDYKAQNLKDKLPQMDEAEAIRLLSKNGNLVKRPFALSERAGLVGFKTEEWKAAF
jgi:arsenate reductase (glutaredoxin)